MWKNRIVGYSEEPPDQLLAHYANTNNHTPEQREALKALLEQVGWVQNVLVNDRTGNMLDGHLRIEEALTEEQPTVPVTHIDVSEEEETKILLFMDPIARLAYPNKDNIELLLETIELDNEPLENLLKDVSKPEKEKKPIECPECGAIFENKPPLKDHPGWRTYRKRARKSVDVSICSINNRMCKGSIQAAHIDQNYENNDPSNVKPLCVTHHRLLDVHYLRGMRYEMLKGYQPEYVVSSGKRRYKHYIDKFLEEQHGV